MYTVTTQKRTGSMLFLNGIYIFHSWRNSGRVVFRLSLTGQTIERRKAKALQTPGASLNGSSIPFSALNTAICRKSLYLADSPIRRVWEKLRLKTPQRYAAIAFVITMASPAGMRRRRKKRKARAYIHPSRATPLLVRFSILSSLALTV